MNGHADALFFAAPSARGFSPYRNAVCIDQSTFRDYFVAALLVPLLRNGANQELSSHKSSKKKEMRSFQGLLRPFGARAAFGGVNRQRGHKIRSLRSVCTFRDYFVASLLVPLLRNGANRHPRITFRSSLLYRSDVVLPLKAQPKKKRNAKAFLFFLGALSGTRTLGPLIKSQLLYQLS